MKSRFCLLLLLLVLVLSNHAAAGEYLGDLTWPEAEQAFKNTPVVILPFAAGSKEHGPHLAMNADQKLLEHLLEQAVEKTDVLVAPPILHGWFPSFRQFPGTEVEDPQVFQSYVFLVAKSLVNSGAQRVLFLNTGIRQATGLPISIAAREVRAQFGVPALVISWDDLEDAAVTALQSQEVGGHADEIETAINLVLQPDHVDLSKAVKDHGPFRPKNYPGYRPGIFSQDKSDPAYSETGIRGDPTLATREVGEKALEMMTANLIRAINGFAQEPLRAE